MDQEKIIDKICKCLRLSESCNPNEAASALRQAHGKDAPETEKLQAQSVLIMQANLILGVVVLLLTAIARSV